MKVSNSELFTQNEMELINKHIESLINLAMENRIPSTKEEEHFLAMCKGHMKPETDLEYIFQKFMILNKLNDSYKEEKILREKQEKKIQDDKREWIMRRINIAMKPNLSEIKSRVYLSAQQPDTNDFELARNWSKQKDFELARNWSKQKDELSRVLSARLAEKAAISFYRSYDCQAEDISIKQIKDKDCSDWKYYDLKINGYPVDVKNSRRSMQNQDRYVEHYVRKFKSSNNQDVTIAGVLSDYLQASELTESKILFMGETTMKKHNDLKNEFEDSNILLIDFGSEYYFFPPWLFDYPEYVYEKRNNALEELKKSVASDINLWKTLHFNHFNPIPVFIAIDTDLKQFEKQVTLKKWEWEFFYKILYCRKKYGLSLPFLFLSILKNFLYKISDNSKFYDNFTPERYRDFIFYDKNSLVPLGLYDPLKTIDGLINALNTLWNAEHDLIHSYRKFKLHSFNILRGNNPLKDKWETLIAYCGGRTKQGKCGKNPLVLGDSKLCECGKLICTKCGYCDEKCNRYIHRD